MKRSLSLILALTMLFALCACGGQQAADAPTEAKPQSAAAQAKSPEAEAPEPAPAGPEKNYVKKEVPLLMEKLEIGVGRLWVNELKSQGPVRPSLDRVTQYRYDEHGDLIEETQSLIPEQNAFFCEGDAEAVPCEQLFPELVLQCFQGLGERWLCNMQLFSCPRHVLLPRNGEKITKCTDFHQCPPLICR